jgi:hypothetical protein
MYAMQRWIGRDTDLTLQVIIKFFVETNKVDHYEGVRCGFHADKLDISGRFCAQGTAVALVTYEDFWSSRP